MKKKGFTLIELLAVIVILAVIAVIITPVISEVIESARKAAAKTSAQGYIDAVKNRISLAILDKNPLSGTNTVSDLESEVEYKGTRIERGVVTVTDDTLTEAKLCVNGYSFIYRNDKIDNSDINYCVDKSNIEISVLGSTSTQELNNQYSYDLDLSGTDISSATNMVCNNNAVPSINENTLHIENIYGDTKCRIESSIATTFANLDDTTNNVVMIKDESISSILTVAEGKNMILDLNGKVLTKQGGTTSAIVNYGDLIINDITGNGKIVNTATGCSRGLYTWGKLTLNGVSAEVNGSCATLAAADDNRKTGEIIVNNSIIKNLGSGTAIGVSSNDDKQLIVNNSIVESTSGRVISIQGDSTGTVELNNGTYKSQSGIVVFHNTSATVNINGGTYITTTNIPIYNNATGTINIADKNEKIYIASLVDNASSIYSFKAMSNLSSGRIYVKSSDLADNCTNEINSNSTGICIFSNYRTIMNDTNGVGEIRLEKAYVVSNTNAIVAANGVLNVIDSNLVSTKDGIALATNGTINLCNSHVSATLSDVKFGGGVVNYTPDVIFSNGTNVPVTTGSGTLNPVSTCPITE